MTRRPERRAGQALRFSAITALRPGRARAGQRPAVDIIAEFVGVLDRLQRDRAGRRATER
ncbi:hypothetical protein ACFFJB_05390 [Camelimonas abortus]|uniref:Uncharacterized protein n=1 Tax=Camelimonas abortus TaxID=1017184 RepID=A0ABV7LFJ7_9HYPH